MDNLPSENEIVSRWHCDIKDPVVSIICAAYNHEMYIEDALKGFLLQKTDFPFVIIIHDDASEDSTAEIISKYATKYPKIIKPILQKNNQFGRLKMQMLMNLINSVPTKYIAICEGDDYWINEEKLQTQYDLMETDLETSICIHNAIRKNVISNEVTPFNLRKLPEKLTSLDVVRRGWFSPTASFFFRKMNFPDVPDGINGDLYILFECSMMGSIKYVDEQLTVYRYGSQGSLSEVSDRAVLYKKKSKFLKYVIKRMPSLTLIALGMIMKNKLASLVR